MSLFFRKILLHRLLFFWALSSSLLAAQFHSSFSSLSREELSELGLTPIMSPGTKAMLP